MAKPSRPARWRNAVARANNALGDLQALHLEWETLQDEYQDALQAFQDEWAAKRQEIRDRWKAPHAKFDDALVDLVCLQSEYSVWFLPENLSDSRLQNKVFDVEGISFQSLRDNDLNLEKFDLDRALIVLEEAEEIDLPKGYGRD